MYQHSTCVANHSVQSIIPDSSTGAKIGVWLSQARPNTKLKFTNTCISGYAGQIILLYVHARYIAVAACYEREIISVQFPAEKYHK